MSYDDREEKLPAWARKLLATERRRADEAERKLAEHLKTVEPTPIWYGNYNNPVYVNDYQVTFELTPGDRFDRIDIARQIEQSGTPYLRLITDGPLIVKPYSRNVIDVYREEM